MTDTPTSKGHGHHHDHRAPGGHDHEHAGEAGKVKDPVCGMTVDPHATAHRARYEGKPYYFCSSGLWF